MHIVEDAGIFSTFRNDLNDTLEIVGMQFKEGKDFETGQNILALVSYLVVEDCKSVDANIYN